MKALREAKAYLAELHSREANEIHWTIADRVITRLVAEIESAPVVLVGESINYGALLAGTGIQNGQRVRVVAVGEEG